MYKHVLITTPTDHRHPLCWLAPLLFFSPLRSLPTSRAVNIISHISSQLSAEKSLKAGNPKGCDAAPTAAAAADLILQPLDESASCFKGHQNELNENWNWKWKWEMENENTCEKERKSRQSTKNNTHNTKSKRNPLHIKRTRMSRGRDRGNREKGALNSRQRLSNTNESTRIRIRIRWVACLFTDVCAQIY